MTFPFLFRRVPGTSAFAVGFRLMDGRFVRKRRFFGVVDAPFGPNDGRGNVR